MRRLVEKMLRKGCTGYVRGARKRRERNIWGDKVDLTIVLHAALKRRVKAMARARRTSVSKMIEGWILKHDKKFQKRLKETLRIDVSREDVEAYLQTAESASPFQKIDEVLDELEETKTRPR